MYQAANKNTNNIFLGYCDFMVFIDFKNFVIIFSFLIFIPNFVPNLLKKAPQIIQASGPRQFEFVPDHCGT